MPRRRSLPPGVRMEIIRRIRDENPPPKEISLVPKAAGDADEPPQAAPRGE